MLDPQLKADLLLMVRTNRVSAYDLARGLLDILGLPSFETAVQALPTSCPKTLRRIFSQGVPMCRSDLPEKPQEHRDTLEVDVSLTALAGEAKVDATQALSAVLRYGNPIARVMGVLEDIRALVRVWFPTSTALNTLNRAMGKDELYPFVLSPGVIDKLGFIHRLLTGKIGGPDRDDDWSSRTAA